MLNARVADDDAQSKARLIADDGFGTTGMITSTPNKKGRYACTFTPDPGGGSSAGKL